MRYLDSKGCAGGPMVLRRQPVTGIWGVTMSTKRVVEVLGAAACMLLVSALARSADNCTGYDNGYTVYAETLDLGNGHSLTVFRQASLITSENSIYNLVTGECSGAALTTPDGKASAAGFCLRKDKDGDTQSADFFQAPGSEKGTWKMTGGTGKFAGRPGSGWFQGIRTDGKMSIVKWGGNCK
jgi:hypothetical protein